MATALITGASRGVGAAIARELAADHDLLLGGRASPRLDALAADLGSVAWPVELTDDAEIAAAATPIESLDVLVHSAGLASLGSVAETPAAEWRRLMEVNLFAVVETTRRLLPALRAAGGHVVVINSGAGRHVRPGWGAYAATKHAVRAFAEALREEEPTLRVTSVYPGRVDTDMQRDLHDVEGRPYDPGVLIRPESIAAAVGHLVRAPRDALITELDVRPTPRNRRP